MPAGPGAEARPGRRGWQRGTSEGRRPRPRGRPRTWDPSDSNLPLLTTILGEAPTKRQGPTTDSFVVEDSLCGLSAATPPAAGPGARPARGLLRPARRWAGLCGRSGAGDGRV